MRVSKIGKLRSALKKNQDVPVSTLERKSGLANLSAAVNTLRNEGYKISLVRTKVRGKPVNNYRLVRAA